MNRTVRICIVSHRAYGAISNKGSGSIGGVEWQTSMLARWLNSRGHDVVFLTWHEGSPEDETVDGIRIIKICRPDSGLPGVRFFHPKWTRLVAAMHRADADVYYHNCGECVTGQMALWCKRNRRAFVFSAASDMDCDPNLPEFSYSKDRILYRLGLRGADRIIVQTTTQQQMLLSGFGLASTVIPMPCQAPEGEPVRPKARAESRRVLWVGRVCPVKRPDRLVDVAAKCPDVMFDLVGPLYPDPACRKAVADAKNLANVTVHGALGRSAVGSLLAGTDILLCTSDHEGFPNTFLEAWSRGVPVISTIDPDGVIARHDLGAVAPDATGLARHIRHLLDHPERYHTASTNALRYFRTHHDAERVQPLFERMLVDAANRRRQSQMRPGQPAASAGALQSP